MNEEEQEVRAAVRRLVGDDEDEIQRMLARYEGCHPTVRGFFRGWLKARLGEQAEWMLRLINIKRIADMAVKLRRVRTIEAASSTTSRPRLYVFLYRP